MTKFYGIVPAAGTGTRFGSEIPKQYLPVLGRPLIWHTLSALCSHPRIGRVWAVVAPEDSYWRDYDWRELGPKLEIIACGGVTRAQSVLNGLQAAGMTITPDDWVLVHDAARPCLSRKALDMLLDELQLDPVGGLLAVPVADTLKRADVAGQVLETLSREGVWQAQTPQMFRYGLLQKALSAFPGVTDEAGAIEAAGYQPRLVRGETNNLKVTYPADFGMASWILQTEQERE